MSGAADMTVRLALRSLSARPVRSAVLACGFGFGIAVMAALLGVGEVILEQARSPALRGGGDLVVSGSSGAVESARFVSTRVLGSAPLAPRVAALSPARKARLFLVGKNGILPVEARGGVPSLERALGDAETAGVAAWLDAPSDRAWSAPEAGDVLRAMDRFHPIPESSTDYADSWAEWLYFNGSAGATRFYLTFLCGPRTELGNRKSLVRLQLDHDGRMTSFSDRSEVPEAALLEHAPDVEIGASRVRLEGTRYRVSLALHDEAGGPDLVGELTLDGAVGGSMPPFTIHGAGGWLSGYTVPVLAGPMRGELRIGSERVPLDAGTGYHDHNWGFWKGVSWQWGQVAGAGLSFVYGRVRPPPDAADASRVPGALAVLGPEGPLGFASDVSIEEEDDPQRGRPRRVRVHARGVALDVTLELDVDDAIRTRWAGRPLAGYDEAAPDFVQLRGVFRVEGRVGGRSVDFAARGAAETFRSKAD